MKKGRLCRKIATGMLCIVFFLFLGSWLYMQLAIPDHLNLMVSEEERFDFPLLPGVTFESE
jgi:hypothetical protein